MFSIVLSAVAGAIVLTIAAGLGYRRARQHRVARTLVIDTPNGITEGRFVQAGGIDQWLQIRGRDRTNPILLILPGSGLTLEPFTARFARWEQHFTLVVWDRRDVGRTRGRGGTASSDTWTYSQLADDGIDIADYLRDYLHQDKIILLGHSQGTIVGTLMAGRRPDLFHAYVGTGQVVDMARNEPSTYRMALDRARSAGNTRAVATLTRLAPPYHDARTWIRKQRWSMITDPEFQVWQADAMRTVVFWPGYALREVVRSARGALFLPSGLFTETMACTPEWLGTKFDVPVVLLHGEADLHTLPELAQEYITSIDAPHKEFGVLTGCGHMALLTRPDLVLDELLAHVRPLATTPHP